MKPATGLAALLPLLAGTPAALPAPPPAGQSGEMPDVNCLRLLRSARIAELKSQSEVEAAWLKRARNECNQPTTALLALLRAHLRNPLPEEEIQEARRDLIAAFDDPSSAPPPGVLEFIAREDEADGTVLRASRRLVERRLSSGGVDRARFLRLKALLSQRLGDRVEATEALGELRAMEPKNEEIAWALLRLLTIQEDWNRAADLLAEMAEHGGSTVRSLYARTLARAGRVEDASEQLEILAGEVDREDALALNNYAARVLAAAWSLRDSGRLEEAERLFRLAERHAPAQGWPSVEAKGALVHLYGTAEERAAHRTAVADRWQSVSDPQSLLNEGANQLASGNFDQAIELLKRAAAELGHLEAVWYNLGFAAYRAERWDEAWQALDRASELNDRRADSFFFSGMAMVSLERWEEAVPRLLRALELDPERRHAHYQLWVCYRSLGLEAEAGRHKAAYDALGDE